MKTNLKNKVALIIAVLLVFTYGIIGIPSGVSGKALVDAISSRIHLGLDLQGGAHLILQVEVKEAINADTDNTAARVQQDLRTANLSFSQIIKPQPLTRDSLGKYTGRPELVEIDGVAQNNSSAVRSLLESKYGNEYDIAGGTDTPFTLTMKPQLEKQLEEKTVEQAIETINDRVNSLGVSEPKVAPYSLGANQILVELPGVSDLERVKSIINSTARLEIHAVAGGPYQDEAAATAALGGAVPPDQVLAHFSGLGSGANDSVYVLKRVAVVAGSDFRSADPGTDSNTGQRTVRFSLTNEAGDRFYEYTSKNINTSMAILMGGRVREVANIESGIRDQGEIRGTFSEEEVRDLSKLLRTGALPASLDYLEDRTVGASLGADSVKAGVTAAVVGVLVVMAFMLIYYRSSGINANLALFLNLVILLGFMGFSKATLTLPGIAGVILTIGMGVDSNVLIFERIREEIRAGKAASAAVDQGFAHAWTTILDTHVTTIVSAAILFLFGSGPIKGFAVTLTFGLAANLFTAVFVSRVIFDAHLNKLKAGEMVSI
ncbi:protein translocase subunit SecD [Telmatobacter bradus]|uniref:protein translocase subunit SecD n=1 Tax=Telmatobacter bradus TaxID=474953 RepID=UPI003B431BE6